MNGVTTCSAHVRANRACLARSRGRFGDGAGLGSREQVRERSKQSDLGYCRQRDHTCTHRLIKQENADRVYFK